MVTAAIKKGAEVNMSQEKIFDTGKVKINYLEYEENRDTSLFYC
jgi:hypothetical protein